MNDIVRFIKERIEFYLNENWRSHIYNDSEIIRNSGALAELELIQEYLKSLHSDPSREQE